MQMGLKKSAAMVLAAVLVIAGQLHAQAPPVPRVSGTVKTSNIESLTVTNATGQDVVVSLSEASSLLQVAPGSKDLKSATPIVVSNIVAGDKVIVTGTAGDEAQSLHASRVIVMKSADIAQSHAAEAAAWQHGGGGLVKSVDTATSSIVIASGTKTLTVQTSPTTQIRRYSGDSVRFEDATMSKFADIKAGDQLRVRGTHSADESSIKAEEIVTGSFRNFSGVLTAIDGTAGTVTLKDVATKTTITVLVTKNSDLRRIPPQMAARFAARASGTATPTTATGAPAHAAGAPPVSTPTAESGGARAGMDLSQMLSRLPTETLGSLKVGDAVMIVATQPASDSAAPTAVTVLAGVEPILQASPKGDMVLTPWSVGGSTPDGGGGGK